LGRRESFIGAERVRRLLGGYRCRQHEIQPRYYFHLTDGKQVLNNHKGIDLSGNAAAREDAVALA
jgi:Domain of unknown function (DUF6894)